MTEEIKYPLESSLLGSNTIYVHCEHRHCHQNYAICLNIIKAREEGRRSSEALCSREIDKEICEAVGMRKEEIKAGYALHYVPRKQLAPVEPVERREKTHSTRIDPNDPGYMRGWDQVGASLKKGDTPPPPRRQKIQVATRPIKSDDVVSFSGALASAFREELSSEPVKGEPVKFERAKPEVRMPVIDAVTTLEPKQETVLERARRLARERN